MSGNDFEMPTPRLTKRYLATLILLVLLIIFGKNIVPSNKVKPQYVGTLLNSSTVDRQLLRQNNVLPGQLYRVTYALRNLEITPTDSSDTKDQTVSLWAGSDFVTRSTIQSTKISLLNTNDSQYYEAIVQAKGRNLLLGLALSNASANTSILATDMRLVLLGANTVDAAKNLRPTVLGQIDTSKVLVDSSPTGPEYSYDLLHKSWVVGQVFAIDHPQIISSVEMKLQIIGNGGSGKYAIEIHPLEKIQDYRIGGVTAAFYATVGEMQGRYVTADKASYRFPIKAYLTPGIYIAAVSPSYATFNILNHLRLVGVRSAADGNNPALAFTKTQKINLEAKFPLKVSAATFVQVNNSNVPSGAVIQDLDGLNADYYYSEHGTTQDYLDYLAITPTAANAVALYDPETGSIASRAYSDKGEPITFRFAFPYDLDSATLEATLVGGVTTNSIFYSTDGNNWTKFENRDTTSSEGTQFRGNVSNVPGAKMLYIKIDPKLSGWPLNGQVYGIGDMRFHAQLKIK